MQRRRVSIVGVVVADVVTLVLLRPSVGLVADIRDPDVWITRVGADAALATLAAFAVWLAAAWVGLGLIAAAVRHAPGVAGRIAGGISDVVLPRIVRRVVASSAGVGVLLAPLPAAAAGGGGGGHSHPHPATATAAGTEVRAGSPDHVALPAPRWPTADPITTPSRSGSPRSRTASRSGTPGPVPAPRWPSAAPRGAATHVDPSAHRDTAARLPSPGRSRHEPAGPDSPATVHPGECLWLIAARRLGRHATDAAIAGSWPRWYAANRSVIGGDPDLIRPGVVLRAPSERPAQARP